MLDDAADSIKTFARWTATTVPQPFQLALAFVLYPLYWIGFVHIMTCMAIVGVFIPFFVVSEFTGSIRLAFLATAITPAIDFTLFVFGVSWAKKAPEIAKIVTKVWIGTLLLVAIGWFVYPLFI